MKNVPCDFMWHLKEITDDLTKVNQLLDGSELGKSSSCVCYLLKHFQWVVSGRLWVLRRYNLASQGDCSAADGNVPSGLWQPILCNWRPQDLGSLPEKGDELENHCCHRKKMGLNVWKIRGIICSLEGSTSSKGSFLMKSLHLIYLTYHQC